MATLLLASAGAALGAATGGTVLGLGAAVVGRAAGAMLGRAIDERLLGGGSAPVETGRLDRLRLTASGEGAAIPRLWGRMRLGGQVIWAAPFTEHIRTTGGRGKARAAGGSIHEFSYSTSLAIALCQGEITHVGRIWADGVEIARGDLDLTLYPGSDSQLPDPHMVALAGPMPAYRGTAYLVIADLDLSRWGNRVPQFSFEVFRPAPEAPDEEATDIARLVRAVALIPGCGDHALATVPVMLSQDWGESRPANQSTVQAGTDLTASLEALAGELPRCESVSLVVSWFGNDLRCGTCELRPRAEWLTGQEESRGWQVSGADRATAGQVPLQAGRPVYGGTPDDASVLEAIAEIHARGRAVMFYPFLLMTQLSGNGLPDPWSGASDQPVLPWRGRITLSVAPGQGGSPDGTAAARAEVAAFFGAAAPGDFTPGPAGVTYSGPPEWSFRRMILHYAHLCAMAGGVEAFCIGSELRGLTFARDDLGFPAVDQLCQLAADVRSILPATRITYAADWSEYHGMQPPGSGDKLFHLDPLWAHPEIDMIGIDNSVSAA